MHIILLSGGSGKRLWPLSNEVRSKQFVKIFHGVEGYESMLQRTFRQISTIPAQISVTVSTSQAQKKILKKYIPAEVDVSAEPCRRNTFPAIALTAAYLHDVKKVDADESIVICPVDPYVDDDFFVEFKTLADLVQTSTANLILLGINPTYPSEKYGYIIPASKDKVSDVVEFKEKPDALTAEKYIKAGGLWNGGVFACKISYVLDKARGILKTDSYDELLKNYAALPDISFDYAVVEREKNIKVVRYFGEWKDVGTWNTLTEVMVEENIGKVYFDKTCENTHVINETDTPIIAMGLKDIVVAASADGILVADKFQSSYMKPLAEKIHGPIRFAEKSWGTYQVIDADGQGLTIKVILSAGSQMNYHSHEHRRETWTVIEGTGRVNLDGEIKTVTVGDFIEIPIGVKHTIHAVTDLKVIEVQTGEEISVEDKILWKE
ncbi:MAG: cupin domain-containing protein [Selenomonadaceae bacterium]|nr:cupin domain-containing protein [Selenomonadaceae bacterium]